MGSIPASQMRVVAAAMLFSTGGAAIKACALTGAQVACFRSGIAALALLAMMSEARRRWTAPTLFIGTAYAVTMILFVIANKLTTAAATIFLQSTAPLYLLLLGPWILREPVRRGDLYVMAVLAVGMALFFIGVDEPAATAPRPLAGNIAGAVTGLTWAITVTGLRWVARGRQAARAGSVATIVLAGNVLACIMTLPAALPLSDIRLLDIGLLVYLGVFQIGLAYVFLTTGIRRVGALEASLLLLVEPAFSPIWAWLVHGETPGPWAIAGGVLIFTATITRAFSDRRSRPV